eukprot:g5720.t1
MSTVGATEKTRSGSSVEVTGTETDYSHPMFSSDEFMMHYYKVAPCGKTYRHDWRVCPFAHVGETAARRHPKFKTEFCSRGSSCSRSFCFFAHKESEVRTFNANVLSSPIARKALSIADGTEETKQHEHQQCCFGSSLPAPINHPYRALDLGLAGQNIWSMRPYDLSRNEDLCCKSALPAMLPASLTSFCTSNQVQPLNLWDRNESLPPLLNHGFTNTTFTTDLDSSYSSRRSGSVSGGGGGEIWNDYQLQPYSNEPNRQDLDILATLCKLLAEN